MPDFYDVLMQHLGNGVSRAQYLGADLTLVWLSKYIATLNVHDPLQ